MWEAGQHKAEPPKFLLLGTLPCKAKDTQQLSIGFAGVAFIFRIVAAGTQPTDSAQQSVTLISHIAQQRGVAGAD